MALHKNEKTLKKSASIEYIDPQMNTSKTSVRSKTADASVLSRSSKCSIQKTNSRVYSKTTDGITFNKQQEYSIGNSTSADSVKKSRSPERSNKTELCLNKTNEDKANGESKVANEKDKSPNNLIQSNKDCLLTKKKFSLIRKSPDAVPKTLKENSSCGTKKADSTKESTDKRPKETSKLKLISDTNAKKNSKICSPSSKLPVKSIPKEPKQKPCEAPENEEKPVTETQDKTEPPPVEMNKEDKLKETMETNFNQLVPLYQRELKKVTDMWISAIYTALTTRTHLMKLLYQAFPSIDKAQFQVEADKLLCCIAHAKSATKSEMETLTLFIKSLIMNQEKLKDEYRVKAEKKKIAETYNYDWKEMMSKIAEVRENIKRVNEEISELLQKKDEIQECGKDIIKKLQRSMIKKGDDIQNVNRQLYLLKQKEIVCKGNVFLNVEDYKNIKQGVRSIKAVQKEYEELKAKYLCQNNMYEKKIKNLETLLEEKTNIFEKENGVRRQLQSFLDELHAQEKHLITAIGKDQFEYFLGQLAQGKDKKMEQIWMIASKLVLKGFLIQIRKLERDRNKMLLQLHSDNSENVNAFANIMIQKDNFIESLKQQMKCYFDKANASKNVKECQSD